jgi:hypothetical protein
MDPGSFAAEEISGLEADIVMEKTGTDTAEKIVEALAFIAEEIAGPEADTEANILGQVPR